MIQLLTLLKKLINKQKTMKKITINLTDVQYQGIKDYLTASSPDVDVPKISKKDVQYFLQGEINGLLEVSRHQVTDHIKY